MNYIENEVELRHGANQLSFQKGGPFLLQSTLSPKVTLETDIKDLNSVLFFRPFLINS